METTAEKRPGRGRRQLPSGVGQSAIIRDRVTQAAREQYDCLGGKSFLTEVMKDRMADYKPGRRIKAQFCPQMWHDDHPVDVDPEGDTVFDITHYVMAIGKDKALQIKDARESSDALQMLTTAPAWIRKWKGAFYIRVQDSIADYFAE